VVNLEIRYEFAVFTCQLLLASEIAILDLFPIYLVIHQSFSLYGIYVACSFKCSVNTNKRIYGAWDREYIQLTLDSDFCFYGGWGACSHEIL